MTESSRLLTRWSEDELSLLRRDRVERPVIFALRPYSQGRFSESFPWGRL